MLPDPWIAVLDTNVLFPFSLRDTVLRAAASDFFRAHWTAEILSEMTRNLVSKSGLTEAQAARLRSEMESTFPEAEVLGYEPLIAKMENQEKDRHVAAAAVKAGAHVIVTSNLKDFDRLPAGIRALSPDDFLCDLYDYDSEGFLGLLREQAANLQRPPLTCDELVGRLAKVVPRFSARVRSAFASRDKRSVGELA